MTGAQRAHATASAGYPPPATQAARVNQALRNVQRAGQDARRAMAERLGLGVTDLSALDHLLQSQLPLGPVELGHRLGISSASATTLVDRLENAGHIIRTADPTDRRRQALVVTDHARQEAINALGPMIDALQNAAAELTGEEADTVVRYLQRAAQIMDAHAHGGA